MSRDSSSFGFGSPSPRLRQAPLLLTTAWLSLCASPAYPLAPVLVRALPRRPRESAPRSDQRRLFLPAPLLAAEGDAEDPIDLSALPDWRTFRARLVQAEQVAKGSEQGSEGAAVPSASWAYDSGRVIETGAVILGGVEQTFGFGLRQQYFHKTVMLVLEHDERKFTKGIILNRPTFVKDVDTLASAFDDRGLRLGLGSGGDTGIKWPEEGKKRAEGTKETSTEAPPKQEDQWKIWFGGDVQSFGSFNPSIICLHSLESKAVKRASIPVMKDIMWTTFDTAKILVESGEAKPDDFWTFCGYAGWGPGQLMGELERKSWYMAAADSQTLLKELARTASFADPRAAGLDYWNLLMGMIGREDAAAASSGSFEDLMLKEWVRANLLPPEKKRAAAGFLSTQEVMKMSEVEQILQRASQASRAGIALAPGTLLRASDDAHSPFLLDNQYFHKSILLIVVDDAEKTVGVILNRPTTKGIEVIVQDTKTRARRTSKVPLRFGGEYAVKDSPSLRWYHCSPQMKAEKVGTDIGKKDGVWECTAEEAKRAMGDGLAGPNDFMVVSGVSVWTKGEKGIARGIQGEVAQGIFQVVPQRLVASAFKLLCMQGVLDKAKVRASLGLSDSAWRAVGAKDGEERPSDDTDGTKKEEVVVEAEVDPFVFDSQVKVKTLADDALRSWISTFFLGDY